MKLSALDLSNTALLVVDMQNGFCHSEGTMAISNVDVTPFRNVIDPIKSLVEAFQKRGRPVLWTVQQNIEQDVTRQTKRLAHHTSKRKRVVAISETWDALIIDELAALASDPMLVIAKHRFSGFYGTRLEVVLRMLGVDALVITGVAANTCVETTIREAYMRDLDVVAVTDCIGAIDPVWGKASQEVWEQYFALLASSRDVLDWLEATDSLSA